jgi:hypothetical protein
MNYYVYALFVNNILRFHPQNVRKVSKQCATRLSLG